MHAIRTLAAVFMFLVLARSTVRAEEPRYDLSKDKVLYCVGYAHLDTQWRWDFCTTIDRYILDTLDQNFALFEKHPGYVFNFTGSVRYEMMKEYYPEKYEQLKKHIAEGRWFVSGSSVDEGDVNVPSAEAIIRQVLLGNEFFRREFGKESVDFMLPDCFGFPASMPSIWAHCGLIGFSTQKLTWGSAVGIPFKIGVWEGLDGKSIIAAFDPGPYVGAIKGRVDTNPQWVERVEKNGRQYGVFADYHYYGVGDMGGAPKPEDVANYLASQGNPDSKIIVALVSSDQMYKDITPAQKARLPKYRGDLLLTEHSAGTLTSQSYMKRWNRKNEILADAAERMAVAADWLGGAKYPKEKLYRSWVRLLANQMHDILPGTSIPRAYRYSWNDEIVASNGFAAVLEDSVGAFARALDTTAKGIPIVVYNPLAIDREDVVECTVHFDGAAPNDVRVFGPDNREVPSQVLDAGDPGVKVAFLAKVPSVGLAVYDVRPADEAFSDRGRLKVAERTIENEHYRVTINDAGDIASVVDKANGNRELLAGPARLVFTYEKPQHYPAWNMDWADRKNPPVGAVEGPARIRIVEDGPVRVAIEVERTARDSIITQRIRLARGDAGRRVEIANVIDWQGTECALKASFPLAATNEKATYNWGMGTIERRNNEPTKYEVPSHEWFDLTDESGKFGVTILEDSKFGSDKPADNEVRLTLLYTPGVRGNYKDQHSQDWGRHDMVYGLYGHSGDWREGRSEWQGRRLNQPLIAFQCRGNVASGGPLGRNFSLARVSSPQVDIRAIKQAERGDWTIVRLQELWGKDATGITVSFPSPLAEAWEVDGQERRVPSQSDSALKDGRLVVDLSPNSPRSFAVRFGQAPARLDGPSCRIVKLDYDADIVSADGATGDGAIDAEGRSIPAEMLPRLIVSEGIRFELGPTGAGETQAISCRGQEIALPAGDHDRLYLLAAASEDTRGTFRVGQAPGQELSIQAWTGFVGQFDDRIFDREFEEVDFRCEGKVVGFNTGYIKRDEIAWFATHRHHPKRGNESYQFSYLFKYGLEVPAGATTLTLPDNPKIKLVALTLAKNPNDTIRAAAPLYDDFSQRQPVVLRYRYPEPPPTVYTGVTPAGKVTIDRKDSFTSLVMGPPSSQDFADASTGNNVIFTVYDAGGRYRPNRASGVVNGAFTRLVDGEVAKNHDDTQRCVWYDCHGRFYADLGKGVTLDRINTYSWHRSNRAPQWFSVWASNATEMPSADIAPGRHDGWTLLAAVNSKELGEGGIHGSSITSQDDAPLGPFRWLLFVAEDMGEGTFFTEIDIYDAK